MAKFCSECGAPLNGGKFCSECGAKAETQTEKVIPDNSVAEAPQPEKACADNSQPEAARPERIIPADSRPEIDFERGYNIYGKNLIGLTSWVALNYRIPRSEAKKLCSDFLETKKDEKAPNLFKRAWNQANDEIQHGSIKQNKTSTPLTKQEQTKPLDSDFSGTEKDEKASKPLKKAHSQTDDEMRQGSIKQNNTIRKASTPLTKQEQIKQRIKENKANGIACCPKCGSTSLTADKKGFSVGKAVVGAALTGGIGLVAGAIGAKKVRVTCLNCGYQFFPKN